MTYPIGSAAADRAYEKARDREADRHFAPPLPVCPWCGCESHDEETCDECGLNMEGTPFYTCPYCGTEYPDDQRTCCGERHIELKTPTCPKCGCVHTFQAHHSGNTLAPECWYLECEKCHHQWNHN